MPINARANKAGVPLSAPVNGKVTGATVMVVPRTSTVVGTESNGTGVVGGVVGGGVVVVVSETVVVVESATVVVVESATVVVVEGSPKTQSRI